MNNDDLRFQNYLVAYLDLVGQRDALRRLLVIPSTPEQERKFIEAARESLGKVLVLREWFAEFFDGATQHDPDHFPPELRDTMRKGTRSEHTIFGMADSYVAAVPLDGTDENCKDLNGVFLAFLSICSFAPRAFAAKMMFRGGIDIGIATRVKETNEIYGSAVVKAIHLESEVAEYPRIVIGDGLIGFLEDVRNQVSQTVFGKTAKTLADICRRVVVQDFDGRQMLDFSGGRREEMDRVARPSASCLGGAQLCRKRVQEIQSVGKRETQFSVFSLAAILSGSKESLGGMTVNSPL